MAVSKKIEGFISQSSWIRKIFEDGIKLKKLYGPENVFDFSLGNPDVPPPVRFKEALLEVAGENIPGIHGYMPNAGYPKTREMIAAYLSKEHSVSLSAEHIIMTCGAGGALNVILKTLLDPGDEVLIPAPFFVEYRFYADNHGGVTRIVNTRKDFSLDLTAIGGAITQKTKIVLINSPNNPTGRVYDEGSIKGLAALLDEKGRRYGTEIYLVSDEPYSTIVYDGVKVPSVLKAYRNSIIATSYSKTVSIPGERIGFIATNPELSGLKEVLDGMILCNRILGFINAPALMQRVIANIQGVVVDAERYRRKRDLLCDGLSSLGYKFVRPEGAFYLFPRTPLEDDIKFVRALQKRNILTVPGSGFGCPGHFRISYCVDNATIINSMKGFGEVLKSANI